MSQSATVLVIDDDPDTVETMREILEEEGHVVLSAGNGLEGLAVAQARKPDLVLLDLAMPVMDGQGFLDAIATIESLADVTVVVLSGQNDAHTTRPSMRKPLRLDTLLELIGRVAGVAPHERSCDGPQPLATRLT